MQLLAGVLGLLLAYSPQAFSDPQGRIEGKAVDALSNAPLSKVRLSLSGLPHFPYHLTVETDETGSFVFGKLPSARFTLFWKKDGYITDLYWDRRPGGSGTLIELRPGEIKKADAVYLGKVGGLAGFAFFPAFYPGVENAQQAQTIELKAGETLSSLVFVLPKTKTFWVRGRFSGAAAEASAPVWREAVLKKKCSVVEERECHVGLAKSSSLQAKDGSFAIFGVSPGNYELVIEEQSKSGSKAIGSIELIVSNSDLEELVVPVVEG